MSWLDVTVNVTRADIDEGVRKSNDDCALARAINRLPNFSGAFLKLGKIRAVYETPEDEVYRDYVVAKGDKQSAVAWPEEHIKDWYLAFDAGRRMLPKEFSLKFHLTPEPITP